MSVVYIDEQAVHYEVFGKGRPVLFLHGWLGSWRYWLPSMEVASSHFRTYAFDLIGFGDTYQRAIEPSIGAYADQVIRFLDALGIGRITLVGHSMGGMVSLKTAIQHPDRIERVVTVGAPIVGSSLAPLLKMTAFRPIARGMNALPWLTQRLFHYFLREADEQDMLEILEDSVKPTADSVRAAVRSMMRTDLRPDLPRLAVPTLVIHGTRDDIVMPSQIEVIRRAQPTAPFLRQLSVQGSRHFPWADQPEIFHAQLMEYLRAPRGEIMPEVATAADGHRAHTLDHPTPSIDPAA
ncbi:MAG: alpha/beta hydrolase [Chloroflexota bacterium]|nr:alpha/beta hydrolase [Chloroflexota bacterium]PLS80538.1 MAG: alpha/beta hydrolase [Chloroflexota bacterium]